ncbi:alpha/beta hydrolase [Tessaracoccus massiliensis]|uniref:alpha/beta hydrolase n=1 Tax=Tessaracoccus massiliensis TaxID=1522311 RepID=UPI0009E41221|nr:alpha/beta fold hydrolase [Tessaracoccus massiliensis]
MKWWRALGWTATGMGLAGTAVGAIGARSLNGPRRVWPPYGFTPFEVGLEAEDVTFRTEDGVRIAGWWFDEPGSESVLVVAHGHRGTKADMLGIGPGLFKRGHSVLLFDFRGSSDSEDGPLSLAFHEQLDLAAAVDFVAVRRPDARIAVVGFSGGASTAILTAAKEPRVEALVLDSPFATLTDVVAQAFRGRRVPAAPFVPIVALANRLLHGYRFHEVRPIDAIADLPPRPILLLHGTEDQIIPYQHALDLQEAAGGQDAVELVTFEGVYHCGGYFADRPGYIALVDDFLQRWLRSGGSAGSAARGPAARE